MSLSVHIRTANDTVLCSQDSQETDSTNDGINQSALPCVKPTDNFGIFVATSYLSGDG